MSRFYTVPLCLLILSCGTRINYLGTSSAPTQKVDVYVDASAIKKPYIIVGKGYTENGVYLRMDIEKLQAKAVDKAREKGADAVLFQDYFVTGDDGNVFSQRKSDSTSNGLTTIKTGGASSIVSSKINILFLKYD